MHATSAAAHQLLGIAQSAANARVLRALVRRAVLAHGVHVLAAAAGVLRTAVRGDRHLVVGVERGLLLLLDRCVRHEVVVAVVGVD